MTDYIIAKLDQAISEMTVQQLEVFHAYVACGSCDRNSACLMLYRYTRQLPHPTEEALSTVRRCQAGKAASATTTCHQ